MGATPRAREKGGEEVLPPPSFLTCPSRFSCASNLLFLSFRTSVTKAIKCTVPGSIKAMIRSDQIRSDQPLSVKQSLHWLIPSRLSCILLVDINERRVGSRASCGLSSACDSCVETLLCTSQVIIRLEYEMSAFTIIVQDRVLTCDLLHVGTIDSARVLSTRSWDVLTNSFHEVIVLLNSIHFYHQQG